MSFHAESSFSTLVEHSEVRCLRLNDVDDSTGRGGELQHIVLFGEAFAAERCRDGAILRGHSMSIGVVPSTNAAAVQAVLADHVGVWRRRVASAKKPRRNS